MKESEKEKRSYNNNLGMYPIDDSIFVGHFKNSRRYGEMGLN